MTAGSPPTGSHRPSRSATEDEIFRQPACWARAADHARRAGAALPAHGERVAVVGCGTSWFMAMAYAAAREQAGHGETDAFAASAFPTARRYDRVVAISRSGTTTEVCRTIDALTRSGAGSSVAPPVTAITAVAASPIAEAATHAVVLPFADERSVVQTVFATTALVLLRASLGDATVDRLGPAVAAALDDEAASVPAAAVAASQVTFLGDGPAYGLALEAALKLREASQSWTEAYPQLEYRHGPIAVAEPGRVVWVFGAPAPNLPDDIARAGATPITSERDPLVELAIAQLVAVRRAEARGLDPDQPRHLTRSVVLAP